MRLLLHSLLMALSLQLAACNTIAGVGKDLESGGQKIQKAAK